MVFIDEETPAAVMDKGAKDRFGSEVHHVACVRHTALEQFDVWGPPSTEHHGHEKGDVKLIDFSWAGIDGEYAVIQVDQERVLCCEKKLHTHWKYNP